MKDEFAYIDYIRRSCAALPDNGIEGIGDDCAVLPIGNGEALVMTADLLVEDVHFLRQATSPQMLGHKSLAVNLSDVAAMGARPVATLLSVALPKSTDQKWAEGFIDGYRALSERFGVSLIGGDTTASPDRIAINVTAIGRAPLQNIKRRRDAMPGDIIAVTGPLGTSAAGLKDILAGRYDTAAATRHKSPMPHVDEGIWLGRHTEVHAMMDLSDGLASDLGHILDLSHAAASIDCEAIPHPDATLEEAVCGGEDYCLLLTAAAEGFETLSRDFESHFAKPLYPIGRITDTPVGRITWFEHGSPVQNDWHGFNHF